MPNTVPFESREMILNSAIDSDVARIRGDGMFDLPPTTDPLVQNCVRKIEGTYDVSRAKSDTDNAIDLLYIAYNTTPQEQDDIRVDIDDLMSNLIDAQEKSEAVMKRAVQTADSIQRALERHFPDWLDIKEGGDTAEIKDFVANDLRKLADQIKTKATEVKDDLLKIAVTYDGLIKRTSGATNKSEKALGNQLQLKAQLEKEMAENSAKQAQLESLVADLEREVAKYEKMAKDYGDRAETAEERAFIMSIVRVGAQMVSAAIPAIAMAAAGPASILAASSMNTAKEAATSAKGGTSKSGGEKDDTETTVKTKTEISEQKAALEASETKKTEIKERIAELEAERQNLLDAAAAKSATEEDAGKDEAADDEEAGEDETTAETAPEIVAIDKRIATAKAELKAEDDNSAKIVAVLQGLHASLDKLDKGLGELSAEQKDQAANLRDMQMKMLDKVEAYEKERRTQAADLVKIKALLKGQLTDQEKYELAIKSLNLSITALKRVREILVEISFFFKSFADFMDQVSSDAEQQIETFDSVAERDTLRTRVLAHLIETTDTFFITQTGKWHAAQIVSDKFVQNFADGWSKLNKLAGTYIQGPELASYLTKASARITEISQQRQAVASARIADIEVYRENLRAAANG